MQDRFKFRYVFEKDFGGKTGICYKMPVFNLDDAVRSVFENKLIEYTNFGYKLIAKNQSTGLKDKNGKLIYEGDIVKDRNNFILQITYRQDKGAFYLENNRIAGAISELKCSTNTMEVIGNIYENPELIGGAE